MFDNIKFSSIIPTSLIDYPDHISIVLFLPGCNFRCHYCHNYNVVLDTNPQYTIKDLDVIIGNDTAHLVDAITISGGEPTLHSDKLYLLLLYIRNTYPNFKIKLDTNGSNPKVIKYLLDNHLVDFIAMDIKHLLIPEKYRLVTQTFNNVELIKESINIITNSNIDYQFRTTVCKPLHTKEEIDELKQYIENNYNCNLVIQDYVSNEGCPYCKYELSRL